MLLQLFIKPAFARYENPELEVAYCAVSPAERVSVDPFTFEEVLACTGPTARFDISDVLEVLK